MSRRNLKFFWSVSLLQKSGVGDLDLQASSSTGERERILKQKAPDRLHGTIEDFK
jgi:hypothetical protein